MFVLTIKNSLSGNFLYSAISYNFSSVNWCSWINFWGIFGVVKHRSVDGTVEEDIKTEQRAVGGTAGEGVKAEQRAVDGTAGVETSSSLLAIADERGTTASSKAMKKIYK